MPTLESSDGAACGWVYVLSHPQMTALKVGFTLRSVRERLDELSGTAVPGSFVWEYGVLVTNPDQVERQTHRLLSDHRVASNREFFSCPLPVAVAALIAATEQRPPLKTHDRSQVEQRALSIRKQRELLDTWVKAEQEAIAAKMRAAQAEIESLKPHFVWFWLGHTFFAALIFEQLFSVKSEAGLWITSSFAGAVFAFFHQDHVHGKRKAATSLQSRLNELDLERQAISDHSLLQSQRIERGAPFESPQIPSGQARRPILEVPNEPKPIIAPESKPRTSASLSLEERIAEVESRVIHAIPTISARNFECQGCGQTINLNVKLFCNELRCPAKLLTGA